MYTLVNDPFKVFPNSDKNGIPIPHEVARPAGLYIYKLAQNAAQEVEQQAKNITMLAIWSNSDVLAVYADVEPVWSYGARIADAMFCPAYSTTVLEANLNSSLWLIPISDPVTAGFLYTLTVQQLQAWKALGQNAQLTHAG